MEITLRKIKLEYFKGVKNLTLEFNQGPVTDILGKNGAGKSTIQDGYLWALFGKNSSGESDSKFSIKTFDANNNVIPKVDHSVTVWLDVDGEENVFKRTLREKWIKKRGNLETEFSGNVTIYEINDVPKKKSEYEQRISQLVSEDVFKLISNPLAFPQLHWEVQRKILIDIVGEVNDSEIATGNAKFEALMDKLSNKDLEEYKSELASKRKKLNDEIKFLPSRIDEVQKSKPELIDFDEAQKKYNNLDKELVKVESEIEDRNKAIDDRSKKRQKLSDERFTLSTSNQNIELETKRNFQNESSDESKLKDLQQKFANKVSDRANAESGIERYKKDKEVAETELNQVTKQIDELRKEWEDENAKEFKFDPNSVNCPTCGRALEAENIKKEKEKLLIQFRATKADKLKSLNERGPLLVKKQENLKISITAYDSRIKDGDNYKEDAQEQIDSLEKQIEKLKKDVSKTVSLGQAVHAALQAHKTYQSNLKRIDEIQAELDGDTGIDISDLQEIKRNLNNDIDEVKKLLDSREIIAQADARIKELSDKEGVYAQQIADLEKQQFVVQEFTTAKINKVEEKVNNLFPTIKFKMFEIQVNGGIADKCTPTYLGVDFPDLNSAGKIKAGIEIVNVLCEHYKVFTPLFIDNSESITEIPPSNSQQIRLYVNDGYEKLTII